MARFVLVALRRLLVGGRPDFARGRGTYGYPRILRWGGQGSLRMGAFCSIANGVTVLLGGNHRTDWVTTYPFPVLRRSARAIEGHPATKGDVVIGNDVWIGLNATILSGVTIGNGAVIGACAVVACDVPAYTVMVGNPARAVRTRFSEEEIALLEQIAWWNWSDSKLDKAMPWLLSGDVAGLVGFARQHMTVL